jgi:diguanylate cyclase (GGDEF)-like protein/PAS domain S-box-containing protein
VSTPEFQPSLIRGKLPELPVNEILVGLAVLVSACISIWLTRIPGGIALFWPGSAIAAALLIRMPQIRWISAAAAVLIALLAANVLAAHRPWPIAALFASVNGLEIALMVGVFRFAWRFPYPDITIGQAAIMTAMFGIALPGIASMGGGLLLHLHLAHSWLQGTLQWWSSHTIGACLLGPPIILFSSKGFNRLLRGRFFAENIVSAALVLGGCYLTIRFVRFPFVSIGLLLLVAAFRMGGFGASLMSLCCGLMITNLWILGIRPIGLDPVLSVKGTLLGLPIIALLATLLPPIAVGLGSDARRAAARALQMSERRFRESMEHSPIGMLIATLDGVWTYSNIALQTMLGYTAQEFRALPPGGPSKPEDWQASKDRWQPLLAGEVNFYDTVRSFQHKDGRWIWTHVAVSILRDDEGSPIHMIAQIESLEARQHAEEKLADERERLRITLQSISDAVITTDADTRITYINAAAESLLGVEIKAVENRRLDEVIYLMDPQTANAAANLLGQSALHGKAFRREQPCLLHRSDGTICFVTDVVSPVFDSVGLLNGMVIVFHDASEEVGRARDMEQLALHDPLTGLSNRTEFAKRLRAVFGKSHHLNRPAAVMAIDLDRFKAVNDTAGHAAGDAVLRKVAEVCRSTVRSSDTVARLGGDEFAIILDNCAEDRARHIGQQLLHALNPLEIEWQAARYSVNASIGLAMRTVGGLDEKAWLEAADKACYVAKREGRGRLQIAAPTQGDEAVTKRA